MKTETQYCGDGMDVLLEKLGMIAVKRFISLISRERFDYAEWQRHLWEHAAGVSVI